MNRMKKEAARKHREAREGLSPMEIKEVDHADAIEREIYQLACLIHLDRFPEEYDFQLDSIADVGDRNRGVNPMNAAYQAKVNAKRKAEGVSPLSECGLPTSDETSEIARKEAELLINSPDDAGKHTP